MVESVENEGVEEHAVENDVIVEDIENEEENGDEIVHSTNGSTNSGERNQKWNI